MKNFTYIQLSLFNTLHFAAFRLLVTSFIFIFFIFSSFTAQCYEIHTSNLLSAFRIRFPLTNTHNERIIRVGFAFYRLHHLHMYVHTYTYFTCCRANSLHNNMHLWVLASHCFHFDQANESPTQCHPHNHLSVWMPKRNWSAWRRSLMARHMHSKSSGWVVGLYSPNIRCTLFVLSVSILALIFSWSSALTCVGVLCFVVVVAFGESLTLMLETGFVIVSY